VILTLVPNVEGSLIGTAVLDPAVAAVEMIGHRRDSVDAMKPTDADEGPAIEEIESEHE